MAKRIGSRRSSPSGGYNSPRSGRNSLYAYTRRRGVAYILAHNVQLAVLAIIASVHLHCTIETNFDFPAQELVKEIGTQVVTS